MDDTEDKTYPPMIKLDIKPAPTSGTPSDYFYIDVVGVREKKFGVSPKLPQGRSVTPYTAAVMGYYLLFGLSLCYKGYHLMVEVLVLHVTSQVG